MNQPASHRSHGRHPLALTSAVALTLSLTGCGVAQAPGATGQTTPGTPVTSTVDPSSETENAATSQAPDLSEAAESAGSGGSDGSAGEGSTAKGGSAPTQPVQTDSEGDDDPNFDDWSQVDSAASIEPGTQRAAVKAYVDAIAVNDTVAATALLSAESRELLGDGLGGDDVLADEPWLSEFQSDVLTFDTDGGKECHWSAHEAWQGAGDDLQVVEITCWSWGVEDSREYGFGVRRVDGTWVVDQDRIDVSTGGTWVEFLNPTWEGAFDTSQPASFSVDTDAGAPEHIMLRANGLAETIPLTESEGATSSTVVYTQSEGGMAMPGSRSLLVTGRTAGSDMIRAHGIVFGVSEGS